MFKTLLNFTKTYALLTFKDLSFHDNKIQLGKHYKHSCNFSYTSTLTKHPVLILPLSLTLRGLCLQLPSGASPTPCIHLYILMIKQVRIFTCLLHFYKILYTSLGPLPSIKHPHQTSRLVSSECFGPKHPEEINCKLLESSLVNKILDLALRPNRLFPDSQSTCKTLEFTTGKIGKKYMLILRKENKILEI